MSKLVHFPKMGTFPSASLAYQQTGVSMKIQFSVTLKDRLDREMVETDSSQPQGQRVITLGDVCCAVLDAPLQGDSGKDKQRAWELMRMITTHERDKRPLDLLDVDVEWIRGRLDKMNYGSTLYGATLAALKQVSSSDAASSED